MTEYMNETTQHLYEDLTLGGVSFWETYGYQGRGYNEISYNNDYTQITSLGGEYWWLRQTMHYVRPGAVRIGCTPSNTSLRAVAFSRNGKAIVVLNNNVAPIINAQNAIITGLPPGQYAASETYGDSVIYAERGVQTVDASGTLTIALKYKSVLTIYPYSGTNLPPVVTSWKSSPNYLTAPASTTTLSAAAVDPELATVSYTWSIRSQPGRGKRLAGHSQRRELRRQRPERRRHVHLPRGHQRRHEPGQSRRNAQGPCRQRAAGARRRAQPQPGDGVHHRRHDAAAVGRL